MSFQNWIGSTNWKLGKTTIPAPTPKFSDFFTKKPFFSQKEYECFWHLKTLFWTKYDILCKVRVVDLFELDWYKSGWHHQMLKKFWLKHVDFVILNKLCESPLLVIELDWQEHYSNKSIESDRDKELLFKSMGIAFLRLENQYLSLDYIEKRIGEMKEKRKKDKQ